MKKNQNGFSLVEVLLVLILITLVSFAGWYVLNRKFDEESSKNSLVNQNNTKDQSVTENKVFSYKELPFTFKYPSDWKIVENKTDYGFYSVRIQAPGTVIENNMGEVIKSGAQIMLIKNQVYNDINTIEKFAGNSSNGSITNKKVTTVDGIAMLTYDREPFVEGGDNSGTYVIHGVEFYKDNVDYSLTLEKSAYDNPAYKKVFDDIASSVKFNK